MAAFLSFNKIGKKVNNINLLANLSFGVQKGEIFFIIGKTNAGKTTLFKILMGFIEKDRGQIFVDGMDYDIRKNEILPMIGYVPQENIFDYNLNIYENLFFNAELYGLTKVQIHEKISYWSDRLNFKNYLRKPISSTTESVLKKVSFARALIHNPNILLFDELTSSMDYYDQNIIFEVIQEIKKTKSILFITKDFNLVNLYSDRIILMHKGQISFNGSIQNIDQAINDFYRYRFIFKRIVPNQFLKTIRENKNINKVVSSDNIVEVSIKDKNVFFDVFKIAIEYELIDLKISDSKLNELFTRVIESS